MVVKECTLLYIRIPEIQFEPPQPLYKINSPIDAHDIIFIEEINVNNIQERSSLLYYLILFLLFKHGNK
jgi:hypothetical protein